MHNHWKKILLLLALITASLTQAYGNGNSAVDATILVIGDSLSAEYGLKRGSGWVNHLQDHLQKNGFNYRIHNSSISGDTTSGGLSRLPAALEHTTPDIVIIELGSNDALRGLSLDMTRDNLGKMLNLISEHGAHAVLVGMKIPPNYGRLYTNQFDRLYAELADRYAIAFVPFLMEGMADNRALFQEDGIHPNEAAQPILADNVWPVLEPLLKGRHEN